MGDVKGLDRRLGRRLNQAYFTENVGKAPGKPGWSAARAALVTVSVLIFAVVAGSLLLGVWWIVDGFPSWLLIPGILLVLLAWCLLPRFGKVDEWGVLTAAQAPNLHALIDKVCQAAGCAKPDVVKVESDFNASAGVAGWRRRRVLSIGLPLWGSLEPDERVALLGHELGHFMNSDPVRGLLTQPAFSVFGRLAVAVRPHPDMGADGSLLVKLVLLVISPVLWAVAWLLWIVQLGLIVLGFRDHQRAEYAADGIALAVAGTTATVGLLDALVRMETLAMAVRNVELSTEPGAAKWRAAAAGSRGTEDRDKSIRDDASLFASHPPAGYRARMIESLPEAPARVGLSETDCAAIDRELAAWYRRAGRDLTG